MPQPAARIRIASRDHDPRLPAIQRTAARVPAATLAELPGCRHLETFLRIDLTLPVVLPFLASCTAGQ